MKSLLNLKTWEKLTLAVLAVSGFGLLVLLAAGLVAYSLLLDNTAESSAPAPTGYDVEYRVIGNSYSADVTYENIGGNTEQKRLSQGASFNYTPWVLSLPNMNRGDFVYISAQTNHGSGVTIGCEIRVNGVVVESAMSEGPYVIATCSGSVR